MITKGKTGYCQPYNAGLQSTDRAVASRLGRLLTTLDTEITSSVCQGEITRDIREFRCTLMERLEADGWSFSYDGGNHMKVRTPGSKKPFPRITGGGQ